jgi:hypothetical protein
MSVAFRRSLVSLLLSLILLVGFEIFSSAVLPVIGFERHRFAFNILLILFLSFRVESPLLPLFILLIQVFHAAFSIEGWADGAFAGVLLSMIMSYVKHVVDFSSRWKTIFIIQLSQLAWFCISSFLIYVRVDSLNFIIDRFLVFIPESVIVSLLSPWFFIVLERAWRTGDESSLSEAL